MNEHPKCLKCWDCGNVLWRKKKHDISIPLGFIYVYYCPVCDRYVADITTYEQIEDGEE